MILFERINKIEYRAVIRYLFLKGNTPTQIKEEMDAVYGDSTPSFTTVKFWAAEFKRGRTSLCDDERSGRPKTATTDENIAKIHQIVLDDRQIKVREIAEAMNISKERVCHILSQDSGKRKVVCTLVAAFAYFGPNTPYHTSAVAMAKIHELQFELVDHPPYSPDLAPSDFFLFPKLKEALGGQKFSSNEEVINFVNSYFEEKDSTYYLDGLKRWEHRWEKCIDLQGDYVEK